jgi:ABC-2 type transport system permease protein
MNTRRLTFVALHTWYHFLHSTETWVDIFWNPAIQIWIYALIALSFSKNNDPRGMYIFAGMIFWQIIWVGQYAITIGALWEIWARSFSSMFISPLSMNEFIVGQMFSGFVKSLMAVVMSCVISYGLYHFSLFMLGWMIPLYYMEFLVFSWSAGLLVLSLIFRYSTQVQSLSWALIFLVQPFGAVFYPVTILPESIRWISYSLPVTFVFETIRKQMVTGIVDWQAMITASVLNGIWFVIGWSIFQYTFKAAKRSGAFARLEG